MKGKLLVAIVASAIVGFVQWSQVLPYCWGYIAMHSLLLRWLVMHGIKGNLLYSVVFIHDTIINVILCLPAAFVLRRLSPRKPMAYLAIAVLTGFLWDNRLLFDQPLSPGMSYGMFIHGMALTLVMLPLASALIGMLDRRRPASL
jgi:hypothetical protein